MKNKKFLFVALAMALALSSCERTTTESKKGTIAESITQDRMSEDASENERENTDSSSTEDHFT